MHCFITDKFIYPYIITVKKLIISLCLLALSCGSVFAAIYRSLVIIGTDGSETSISYQEGMKMTFYDRQLTLSSASQEQTEPSEFVYHFDDVEGFRFSSDKGDHEFTATDQIQSDSPTMTLNGATATVNGLTPGQEAAVYDIAGHLLLTAYADSDGTVVLDFSQYRATVLIVKIGTFVFKTTIR